MKLFNTITACLLLCAGLVSCEMKDELKGSGAGTSEVGYLSLGVAVNASQNSVVSRADNANDDGENVGVAVSADDFPVTITGVTDPSYSKEYESYAALKAENGGKVELPIGEYTVTAHSNAELEPQMATPYYEGTTPIKITAGVESSAEVKCTMKNMKIQLTYTANFLAKFESWDITINDGNGNILNFDETDKNPAAVYWMVAENVTEIKVAITATPMGGGQEVPESRLLSKPDGSNWAGSDALTIQMEEKTSEDPTGIQGSGITINASVSFDEDSEDVPVTVKPDEEEPEEPEIGPAPTLSGEYLTKTLNFNKSTDGTFPVLTIEMEVPNGIKDVIVTADSDNLMFKSMLASEEFGLTAGASLITNTTLAGLFPPPTSGADSYTFTLNETMGGMLTNFTGNHKFTVKVIDEASLSAEGTLNISITE